MYAAAHNLDIEWVVIKGISGYADGRKVKDSWRTFASFMAASLTAHILSDTIAFQALPHYGSASEYWTFRKRSCWIFPCHLLFFSWAQLWFCSSHNPTSKSFEKFASNQAKFCLVVQIVILGKLNDKWLCINFASLSSEKAWSDVAAFFDLVTVKPF